MKLSHLFSAVMTSALLIAPTISHAQSLDLDIRKASSSNPFSVALVPFAGDSVISGIISGNLNHTELKTTTQNLPHTAHSSADYLANQVAWQQAGYPYVVVGSTQSTGNGKVTISFEVIETATGRVINGRQTQLADANTNGLRYAAHVVSDKIYELITGIPGDFSGRIAFVEETGSPANKTSTLKVMDADGQNVITLHSERGSIFSPAWSPDGKQLAYAVQRPNAFPVIYIQNADGGGQRLVTPFKGNNLGPSWSPDGANLLFSGSHENNDPAIYQLHLASGQVRKLTQMTGAENSP
ncbi:MAG: translocation protein TolB, partial [Moraxella sp.]|nr:translocation protein TolB [Moraxella sp.]